MKKLFFLSLFLLGGFVATQAQVDYIISNQSAANWTYTVTDGGSSIPVSVASGNIVKSTYPDFVEPAFTWTATDGTCVLGGTITAAPSSGTFTCGSGSTLDYTFSFVGFGPGGAAIYSLVVKIN